MRNEMRIEFDAKSVNEGFARVSAAVSEAVTNAIIHGYEERDGKVYLTCILEGDMVYVSVEDKGVGMSDVRQAMEPFYTTKPEMERSGMGFAFMEAFMDDIQVESKPGMGTKVTMTKKIGQKEEENQDGCGDSSY